MGRSVIDNKKHVLVFKPLNCDKEMTFEIDSPGEGYVPISFRTATANMQAVKINGEIYIEHLRVDGSMELIPYKGVHADNDNFVNIGWCRNNSKVYLRIDIYNGQYLRIEE